MTIPFRIKKLTPTAKIPHQNCESDLWDLYADDFLIDRNISSSRGSVFYDKKVCDYENYENNNFICNFESEKIGEEYYSVEYSYGNTYCSIMKSKDRLGEVMDTDFFPIGEGEYSKGKVRVFKFDKLQDAEKYIESLTEDKILVPSFGTMKHKAVTLNKYSEYQPVITLKPQGRILVKTGIAIELPKQFKELGNNDEIIDYYWLFLESISKEEKETLSAYAVADIRPRSGMALKAGITVLNTPGTIDNSYRKEIGIILINHGHEPYTINKGDKIAQMLIRSLTPSKMEVVEYVEDTGRGGFGSTGK